MNERTITPLNDGNNPPAFPSVCLNDPDHPASVPGMSLRDYFAGQAITGICAASIGNMREGTNESTLAYGAYVIADEMLAARKENGQ